MGCRKNGSLVSLNIFGPQSLHLLADRCLLVPEITFTAGCLLWVKRHSFPWSVATELTAEIRAVIHLDLIEVHLLFYLLVVVMNLLLELLVAGVLAITSAKRASCLPCCPLSNILWHFWKRFNFWFLNLIFINSIDIYAWANTWRLIIVLVENILNHRLILLISRDIDILYGLSFPLRIFGQRRKFVSDGCQWLLRWMSYPLASHSCLRICFDSIQSSIGDVWQLLCILGWL